MVHSAPWSKLLVGVSSFACAILLAVTWVTFRFVAESDWLGPLLGAVSLATIVGAWVFSIRGYRIDGAHLYVLRPFWEAELDLRDLESVEIDPGAMRGSIRLFGNGGLFSFSGIYRSANLGRYRAFVTDHDRAVVLRFPGRTAVVSPGDPEAFATEVLGGRRSAQVGGTDHEEENR